MTTTRRPGAALGAVLILALTACQGSPPPDIEANPDPPARAPGEVECRWARGLIEIDGRAHEGDWTRAELVSNFSMPWLGADDRPARVATRARLLWNAEYFYFFAELDDADLFADITEHDGRIWMNDAFEIFLKPAVERPGYYEFHVSPAGTKLDIFFPARGSDFDRVKSANAFDFQAAAVCNGTLNVRTDTDKGWTAEGRIAWKSFAPTGGRPRAGDRWTFALCRYDYTAGEKEPVLSTCAPLKKRSFHAHEDFAPLRFVGPPRP